MAGFPEQTNPAAPTAGAPRGSTPRIHRGFIDGFGLARAAWRTIVARPSLIGAILLLASCGFLSSVFITARFPIGWTPGGDHSDSSYSSDDGKSRETFLERWKELYTSGAFIAIVGAPLVAYCDPLSPPSAVVTEWASIPQRVVMRWHAERRAPTVAARLCAAGASILRLLALPVMLIALLGWMRDDDESLRLSAWLRYWRHHYVAVLLVALALAIASMPAAAVISLAMPLISDTASEAAITARVVMYYLYELLVLAPLLLFLLAPYAIVMQRLNAERGIVEGCRLLRSNWLALVALLVMFRVGYEVVSLWNAATPLELSREWQRVWQWAGWMAQAALGLWLAHAFMEIAEPPRAYEQSA